MLAAGEVVTAFMYLVGTLLAGLLAVWAGIVLARGALALEVRRRRGRGDTGDDPRRSR
jgi:CrcB protein